MSVRAVASFILCVCLMAPGAGRAMATDDASQRDATPAVADAQPSKPAGGCHDAAPAADDGTPTQADGEDAPAATPCCGTCDCGCRPASPTALAITLSGMPDAAGGPPLRCSTIASLMIDPPLRPPIS